MYFSPLLTSWASLLSSELVLLSESVPEAELLPSLISSSSLSFSLPLPSFVLTEIAAI